MATKPQDTPIKVFRVNDYEWWAGTDLESIGAAFQKEYGYASDDPGGGFDHPYELTERQLTEHVMHEWDEGFEDGRGDKPSFREYLDLLIRKGRTFPRMLASTEY